jgi:hypothetical protein
VSLKTHPKSKYRSPTKTNPQPNSPPHPNLKYENNNPRFEEWGNSIALQGAFLVGFYAVMVLFAD